MGHHLCALGGLALAQVLPEVADEQGRHAGDARARAPQVEARVIHLVAAPQLLELGRAEQRQPRLVRVRVRVRVRARALTWPAAPPLRSKAVRSHARKKSSWLGSG